MISPGYFESNRLEGSKPFFSICIPQYNRTDFLIKACQTFIEQDYADFELCISDDCSDDSKETELLNHLKASGLTYTYAKTDHNLRFDGNLRSAIGLSVGEYVVLMGNDDGMSDAAVLRAVHQMFVRYSPVDVAITNYRAVVTGETFRRIAKTGVLGSGPATAVSTFRNYSFVSGIVLRGDAARQAATDALDGSEMYQMYLGTRLIAAGGRLLGIDRICIDKDLQIAGRSVDSYRARPRVRPCPIVERPLPIGRLLEVVAYGLGPHRSRRDPQADLILGARQLYRFTYPFWILEYRRIQSWCYAVGVYLALRPSRIAKTLVLSRWSRIRLWGMYLLLGALSLTIPIGVFDVLRPLLYAFAKKLYPAT